MKKLLTRLAFWLLRNTTLEYHCIGVGTPPYLTVYIDGKTTVRPKKWSQISVVFNGVRGEDIGEEIGLDVVNLREI